METSPKPVLHIPSPINHQGLLFPPVQYFHVFPNNRWAEPQGSQLCHPTVISKETFFPEPILFFKDFIYLFMRGRERQRHRQREKQAPCGEPECGALSQDPGITTWAKGSYSATEPPRCPQDQLVLLSDSWIREQHPSSKQRGVQRRCTKGFYRKEVGVRSYQRKKGLFQAWSHSPEEKGRGSY